jgi:hypothetical protein
LVHKIRVGGTGYYDSKDYSDDIINLDVAIKDAKISDALRNAMIELKDALKRRNYNMAYELSSVKSFIVHDLKFKKNAFREASDFNEKKLGTSMYSFLDCLHHKISFNLMEKDPSKIPSGSMIMSAGGIQQKGLPPESKSPTLKRIDYEAEQIRKETEKRLS